MSAYAAPDEDDDDDSRAVLANLFGHVTSISDQRQRLLIYPNAFFRLRGELTVYGRTDDGSMIPMLKETYLAAAQETHLDQRTELYELVVSEVEQGRLSSNVLIPFIGSEAEGLLVSRAAIDYVMLHPRDAASAMAGAAIVCRFIGSGELTNVAAAFGGLLSVGDARVCALLVLVRRVLTRSDLDRLARIRTGFVSAASIEFLMDWIEACIEEGNEDAVGPLAACICNHVTAAQIDQVIMEERAIPPWAAPSGSTKTPPVPLRIYLASIMPRLLAIEARETEPKVMPHLREYLGLS